MLRIALILSFFAVSGMGNHTSWGGVGYGRHHFGHPVVGFSFRRATFGTIAYSWETDRVGYSSGAPYLFSAEHQASAVCGASDCRSVVWVQGGCASIATSRESRILGWAYGPNRSAATHWALQSCRNHGGTRCEPRAWVCSW